MIRPVLIAAVLALVTLPGEAQLQPEFDVASVKPVDISKLGGLISMNIGSERGEEITFDNATLNDCVRFAYGVASNAQIDGPDWIRSKQFLYDIDAKAPPGTSHEQFQAMMQTLLAARFKLVIHREQRLLSYYSLVTAKGGPKMPPTKDIPVDFQGITHGGRIDSILPMPMLAYLLSRFETERPIIDHTGLKGMYRVKLQWSLQQVQNGVDEEPGPSLFTALEEQLGLKLDSQKGPIDVLVVESAEKVPTQN
jgi:uncharacterized protein (TIGR03435 family)